MSLQMSSLIKIFLTVVQLDDLNMNTNDFNNGTTIIDFYKALPF